MIFVTVGTQKFPMNRLIKKVDEIAVDFPEDTFFMQIGNSDYIPRHVRYEKFINKETFQSYIENSNLIISHAGVGSIMAGVQIGKKVIVIPRLKRYGEHVDDHQVEIAEAFQIKNCIIYCKELNDLDYIINHEQNYQRSPYIAPCSNVQDIIFDFIK